MGTLCLTSLEKSSFTTEDAPLSCLKFYKASPANPQTRAPAMRQAAFPLPFPAVLSYMRASACAAGIKGLAGRHPGSCRHTNR